MEVQINININEETKRFLSTLIERVFGKSIIDNVKDVTPVAVPEKRYKKRLKLDHDTVALFVDEYESVLNKTELLGSAAVTKAMKNLGLKCALCTAERALFLHEEIEGYEDIPTPRRTYARESPCSPVVRNMVEEIKYLQMKGLSLARIIELTGFDAKFSRRVFDKQTYTQVCVSADNSKVFDYRYKDVL